MMVSSLYTQRGLLEEREAHSTKRTRDNSKALSTFFCAAAVKMHRPYKKSLYKGVDFISFNFHSWTS